MPCTALGRDGSLSATVALLPWALELLIPGAQGSSGNRLSRSLLCLDKGWLGSLAKVPLHSKPCHASTALATPSTPQPPLKVGKTTGSKTTRSKQNQATALSMHPQPYQAQGNRTAPKGAIPNCSKSSGQCSGLWQLGFVQQSAKACAHPQCWACGGIAPCPSTEGPERMRDLNHGQGKAAHGGEKSAGTLKKGG